MAQEIQHIEMRPVQAIHAAELQPQAQDEQKQQSAEERRTVRKIVSSLNEMVHSSGVKISFSVDASLKKTIIKVIDVETQKVIRQIPSEEVLKVSQNIQSMMGLLYDGTA